MDDVVEVDPSDGVAFAAWYDVYAAAERFGREETAQPWLRPELQAELSARPAGRWSAVHALHEDGRVVAVGSITLPLLDNLALAQVEVHTRPECRRRGHGTRMLGHLERLAAERGRDVLTAEAAYPFAGPVDGTGAAGVEFARARGFDLALGDVMRTLSLPVDPLQLARLGGLAARHHASYTLRTITGRVPDDLARGWNEVAASLPTEAPTGDLDLEPEQPSLTTLRDNEEILAAQRRTRYAVVALTAEGEVAAYTDIVVPELAPGTAFQWGTLVRREHRGHRLGLALKVANLRALQAARTDVHRVVTWNAEVNRHMIGVNEQLGYRPVERLGEFQKRLPPPG